MQTFWRRDKHGLAAPSPLWRSYILPVALAFCFLTGSASGAGLVGAGLDDGGIPLPPRKPAALIEASLPGGAAPLPPRKPETQPAKSGSKPGGIKALLGLAPAPAALPAPARKPIRTQAHLINDSDAALYREIFAAEALGEWDKADKLMGQLREDHLRGHVLFQRYMHPSYRTSFAELEDWLARYADLPGADKIHRLARLRMPAGYKGKLREPVSSRGISGYLAMLHDRSPTYSAAHGRSSAQQKRVNNLFRAVRKDVSNGAPTRALGRLKNDGAAALLDDVEKDQLRAHIATGYMFAGKIDTAYKLAAAAAKRSGSNAPMAGWTGGLSAWRLGKYKESAALFEQVAASPFTSSWMSAGGAYWASRAHMRAGQTREVSKWLRHAAAHPRTFYGLIATRALGWDFDFNWAMPELTAARLDALKALPAGRRAIALVAAGQNHLAEEELRRINPGKNEVLRDALLAYANEAGLPSLAMRLAEAIAGPEGALYDAALYPIAPWEPEDGYAVDSALIHAIIRQESRFDPAAQSPSGATGLMQLMPRTASYVAGDRSLRDRNGLYSLKDPRINLAIGQRYVADLLKQAPIETDLFSLAIAYNAGPGNLRRWKSELAEIENDPLLFVESIPVSETRAFVERVLANYWIYRLRMGQETPSLDSVAAGEYARYVSLDDKKRKRGLFSLASN